MAMEKREWWREARSLYCPAAAGAGSALMSFGLRPEGNSVGGMRLDDAASSFSDLPRLLDEARRLGSSTIYLVDYWDGGYFFKGDYLPRRDFGGTEALRRGVDAVHEKGGRVILYLEAFICSRGSAIGKAEGPAWAMLGHDGAPLGYQGDESYYQMWPGAGSGWAAWLAETARRLIADCNVDGFHLDSYGCQAGWHDHHPRHRGGREPGEFDDRAVDLVRNFTEAVQGAKPDAVVMMEGSDVPRLLAECHGSQDWSLSTLLAKPWLLASGRKVFCSEFGLGAMQQILDLGASVSLARWWLGAIPTLPQVSALAEADITPANGSWNGHARMRAPIRDLWWCHDVLTANGLVQPGELDLSWLRACVPPFPAPCDASLGTPEGNARWRRCVGEVAHRYRALDRARAREPADYLRAMIRRAERSDQ
jgi:hypothetical protein